MIFIQVDVKLKFFISVIFLVILKTTTAWDPEYSIHNSKSSSQLPVSIVALEAHPARVQRSVPLELTPAAAVSNATTATTASKNVTVNTTEGAPPSTTPSTPATPATPTAAVTQIPLLGVNGSGILKINISDYTPPKVSDPITPDDNFSDMFNETPERIKSEQNLTNLSYDDHHFYNSTFIGNVSFFNEFWANITKTQPQVHEILSNSHRRATSLQLQFAFPFYGHYIRNITVATGGFIYTGEHVHNWLAATQYIAPLMANFDTRITNDSFVKLVDDGEKFSAFWENVNLQDDANKTFTFAVTLFKNGDIVFAYKQIPIDVQQINDTHHPVKVGISDAYLNDNIMFYVRRQIIYEYHRVSFRNHMIDNSTILWLSALPTCLQYNTCDSCLNHDTGFNCTWCPQIQKCSSGADRNRQDWKLRNCDKTTIREAAACAAPTAGPHGDAPGNNTIYNTDPPTPPNHNTTVDTVGEGTSTPQGKAGVGAPRAAEPHHSAVGGVVVAFLALTLLCGGVCWVLYAFKNPHTRSGQILIKYRPSQWSWRRGEARYTAATIHM